jgi:hypothetical protein
LSNIAKDDINSKNNEQQQNIMGLFGPAWAYTLVYRLLNKKTRVDKLHALEATLERFDEDGPQSNNKTKKTREVIINTVDVWGTGMTLLNVMVKNPRLKDNKLLDIIEHMLDPDLYERYTAKKVLVEYDKFLAQV